PGSRPAAILPPRATTASCIGLTTADDGRRRGGKGRRKGRMPLMHGDLHARDLREPAEHRFGNCTSRGLDQSMSAGAKDETCNVDDLIVAHRVRKLIGAGR